MRINTNVSALNTLRTLGKTSAGYANSVAKLSSGFRINKAADDAAGLGIANQLRADIRSMQQASRNAEQANSLLQVAEGGVQTVSNILDRMKELATQAASDNVDDAGRGRIKAEWDELVQEIDAITTTTKFQGKTLLDGNFGNAVDTANSTALTNGVGSVTVDGAGAGDYSLANGAAAGQLTMSNGGVVQTLTGVSDGIQTLEFDAFGLTLETDSGFTAYDGTAASSVNSTIVQIDAGTNGGSFLVRSSGEYTGDDVIDLDQIDVDAAGLGIDAGSVTITGNGTRTEWADAISAVDGAIADVNTVFGDIGAAQNRIDYAKANTDASVENYQAAESVIRDVDMAAEVTQSTKFQILQQAGTAMLAQANAAPQTVLQLLG